MVDDPFANYLTLVNTIYQQLNTILAERKEKKERLHAHILFSTRVLVASLRELNNQLKRNAHALSTIDTNMTLEERKRIASDFSRFVLGQTITPNIRRSVCELHGFLKEINDAEELAQPIRVLVRCSV